MMIILDTNVISEMMKATPNKHVMRWIGASSPASLYITTITQAEILYGIMLLPAGKRRTACESAANAMFSEEFGGRILSFASDATTSYAQIASERRRTGHPISHFDSQIAAIAYANGAGILTRNVTDFHRCGIEVINPWEAES
jgi:predicted nucleic acid-binding protein